MSEKKISELGGADPLDGDEEVPVVQGSDPAVTVKATAKEIAGSLYPLSEALVITETEHNSSDFEVTISEFATGGPTNERVGVVFEVEKDESEETSFEISSGRVSTGIGNAWMTVSSMFTENISMGLSNKMSSWSSDRIEHEFYDTNQQYVIQFYDYAGSEYIVDIEEGSISLNCKEFGLYGSTPVEQPSHIPDADGTDDHVTINAILAALRNLGIIEDGT